MTGVVEWFNKEKGRGFIRAKTGVKVFAHYSQIITDKLQTMATGDTVEFDIKPDEMGMYAARIHVISEE